MPSTSLPTAVVDFALEFAADLGGNALREPGMTRERIVALLVQDELAAAAKACVGLAVLVEVWSWYPRAVACVQEEDHTLANVDEHAHLPSTSRNKESVRYDRPAEERSSPLSMLGGSTKAALLTTDSLTAKHLSAKQAHHRIHELLACGRALGLHHHF